MCGREARDKGQGQGRGTMTRGRDKDKDKGKGEPSVRHPRFIDQIHTYIHA